MNPDEMIQKYLDTSCVKCGFLTCGNKSFYLFGKQCCEATLIRLTLSSESTKLSTDSVENLLVTMRGECCEAYLGGKKILRLKELLISYEIPLESSPIFGIMTGGRTFPTESVQFSDIRIAMLINMLIDQRKAAEEYHSRELSELARSLDSHEVRALSRMYAAFRPIEKNL